MTNLGAIAYPLGAATVVIFGLAACAFAYRRQRKQGHDDSPEFFLTARNSLSTTYIAWSFYAGAMGSWAIFGPPSYCLTAGVLGMIMYGLSSGFPILFVAYFGVLIQRLVPNVMGIADFINRRFGRFLSLYVACNVLFNMGIALSAEYTAVGDLFEYVIGSSRWPIVVLIGVVAMLYTAWGGLYVSIITDLWQAMVSILVVLILFIFVAVTFRHPLPPLPTSYLGYVDLSWGNYYGLASIAVMPISLVCASVYSEAIWQRCWASADSSTLLWGAFYGSTAVSVVVSLLGLGGLLAAWGGVWVPASPDDYGNTILFSLLGDTKWIVIAIAILSVTMSTSAIDSLQNAIVDTISVSFVGPLVSHFLPGYKLNLWYIRLLVLVLNVPPIIVSLQSYNILQLFLLANLVTTTSTVPILFGVIPGRRIQTIVTPFSVASGCIMGLASIFGWAVINKQPGEVYDSALHRIFFESYDYPPFLLALGCSVVGVAIGALMEWVVRMVVPSMREYPYYDLASTRDTTALETTLVGFNEKDDDSGEVGKNTL